MSTRPTIQDVAQVDLMTRARIVRRLVRELDSADERCAVFEAAFLIPRPQGSSSVPVAGGTTEQLAFDLGEVAE